MIFHLDGTARQNLSQKDNFLEILPIIYFLKIFKSAGFIVSPPVHLYIGVHSYMKFLERNVRIYCLTFELYESLVNFWPSEFSKKLKRWPKILTTHQNSYMELYFCLTKNISIEAVDWSMKFDKIFVKIVHSSQDFEQF